MELKKEDHTSTLLENGFIKLYKVYGTDSVKYSASSDFSNSTFLEVGQFYPNDYDYDYDLIEDLTFYRFDDNNLFENYTVEF